MPSLNPNSPTYALLQPEQHEEYEEYENEEKHICKSQWRRKLPSWLSILMTMIIGLGLGLLISFSFAWKEAAKPERGRLINLPYEGFVFNEREEFMTPTSEDSNRLWHSLIPGGGGLHGMVVIDNARKYSELPLGVDMGDGRERFGVSMYHQLHCLISIREIFWGLLLGRYNGSSYNSTTMSSDGEIFPSDLAIRVDGHTAHCFDYLRQAIMCAGDMTLEGIDLDNNVTTATVGWGTRHECRSQNTAKAWMQAHQPEGV